MKERLSKNIRKQMIYMMLNETVRIILPKWIWDNATSNVLRGDNMKSIVRIKKNADFVVMDKTFLNDKSLSWKAKGIMAYMLSKPDDWTFYIDELIKHSTDGKSSFRSGFKELKEQ